jgi:hypothetical protein
VIRILRSARSRTARVFAFSRTTADLPERVGFVRPIQSKREDEHLNGGWIESSQASVLRHERPTELVGSSRDFVPVEAVGCCPDPEPVAIAHAQEASFFTVGK